MPRDVFISYRSEDKDAANRICAALERENISCWIAPRDIPISQEWATAIVEGLQRSKSFVLILSSHSKNAKQVSREAELADQHGLPIVTFRIEDVQPPPGLLYFLGNIQWLDAFGDQFDTALKRLADMIRQSGNYPAQQTTTRAAVQVPPATPPAFSPVAKPAVSATPPQTAGFSDDRANRDAGSPARWIAIAIAAVLVLAFAGWLLTRHAKPTPTPIPPAAKAAAEKFVTDRNSGDYEAAWAETAPGFNGGVQQQNWIATARRDQKATGKIQRRRSDGCKLEPDGNTYACEYALFYESGRSAMNTVAVQAQPDGTWKVLRSRIEAQ